VKRILTAVFHNKNNPLANRSQVDCGLPSSALRLQGIHAAKPVAICSQIYTTVCGNPQYGYFILDNPRSNTADCHNPRHTFERGTEFQLPPFYIASPPVWCVFTFWRATFQGVKLIRSGLFRPKLITNCFSWQIISRTTLYKFAMRTLHQTLTRKSAWLFVRVHFVQCTVRDSTAYTAIYVLLGEKAWSRAK
jgi:hypothetical protein